MSKAPSNFVIGRYLSLLALALVFFAGCSKQKPETYTIGYVGSPSGANGAILAAEQATASKSSPYKAVKIIGIDATSHDFNTAAALKTLNSAGAQIAIDGSGSMLGADAKAGEIVLLTTGPNPKAQSAINDPLERAAVQVADQLWADKLFSVSIVFDLADVSYNRKWVNTFRTRYEKNRGVILKEEKIDSLQEGWEKKLPEVVKEALMKESRALVVVAGPETAGLIIREARNSNKTIPLASAEQASPTVLLSKSGNDLEGALVVALPPTEATGQTYERFAKDYTARFNGPANLTAAAAYDAVGLIVTALGKGGPIVNGLTNLPEYHGVLGTARNSTGTFTRETTLGRVSNGKLSPVPTTPGKKS